MNALNSLHTGREEDSGNVNALLLSTQEIERRIPEVNRWLRLWKKDVRDGWAVLGRFKVTQHFVTGYPPLSNYSAQMQVATGSGCFRRCMVPR